MKKRIIHYSKEIIYWIVSDVVFALAPLLILLFLSLLSEKARLELDSSYSLELFVFSIMMCSDNLMVISNIKSKKTYGTGFDTLMLLHIFSFLFLCLLYFLSLGTSINLFIIDINVKWLKQVAIFSSFTIFITGLSFQIFLIKIIEEESES